MHAQRHAVLTVRVVSRPGARNCDGCQSWMEKYFVLGGRSLSCVVFLPVFWMHSDGFKRPL